MSSLPTVDLRSDTVTKPTPLMREAMMAAPVGDDVYGEDPSVNRLEAEVARLLGKEAALYVPSGTMANQLALNVHTRPGDSVLCEQNSHCFIYEAGAGAALSGLQFDVIPFAERLSDEAIATRFRPDGLHDAATKLLVIENTHNRGGGRALGPHELKRITTAARELGLSTHCDGARLWNAAVATGASEADLALGFDSVAVCFSKGLGAPVGSALCGSKALIARARKVRKRWGGGMRQAGFLAGAALYALDHHRRRLFDDHRRAAALGQAIAALAARFEGLVSVEAEWPLAATNMVYFRLAPALASELVGALAAAGIRMNHLGNGWIRAVVHLEIDDSGIERTVAALTQCLPKLRALR